MATITIPKRITDNFGDGLNRFFNVIGEVRELPAAEPVILDMTGCHFLTPFFLLPLFLFMEQERKNREVTIRTQEGDNGFTNYLQYILFETGMQPEALAGNEYANKMNEYAAKTYIPIINFPATRTGNNTDIRDTFLGCVNNLLTQQLGLNGNFRTGIMYLIDEAVNNIVDHSGAERGFIFAQYFRANGYIDICIADSGITILGSYKKISKEGIETDEAAIIGAANGISTKDRPKAESRGFGISTSKEMLVKGLKGKYFLLSGNAFLLKTLVKDEVITIPDILKWHGTIVALRIPYAGNIDFNPAAYYG